MTASGLAATDVVDGQLHRAGVALVVPRLHRRQPAPLQGQARSLKPRLPVGIVLVQDGNTGDAQVFSQPGHHFLGLLVVRGAKVQDVVQVAVAQEFRTGEGSDEGDAL